MLTLALETSTRLGSIAVGHGEELAAEYTLSVRATHSETVLDEVDRMLRRVGADPSRIRRLVIGAGPGSFIGVRIGAALAKGWHSASGAPLFAYSSLRAVAASAGPERTCALFGARRGEVYGAAYEARGLGDPVLGPAASEAGAWLDQLGDVPSWSFAGDGATMHRSLIEGRGGTVLPGFLGVPRAAALLWLAERMPEGRVGDVGGWEPRYVRSSGAERRRSGDPGRDRRPARPELRPMVEADIPHVAAIERASFRSPWPDETFSDLLAHPGTCMLVAADDGGNVAGYAAAWFAGRVGHLGDLAVAPSERRRGIATRLVRAVVRECRSAGARELLLEVRESNGSAQRLYAEMGFEDAGRRTGYYRDPPEDAVVMRLLIR